MDDLMRQKPYVIFLGFGPGVADIIRALNKDYDVEPYIYSEKRPSLIPGMLRYKFIRLKYPGNRYCALRTLLDFNDEVRIRQTTLLIPTLPEYERLVNEYRDTLETSFIITTQNMICEILPTLAQKRQKG
jgi:predicted ATP-grasp superfamily ATP-dependent carboligase